MLRKFLALAAIVVTSHFSTASAGLLADDVADFLIGSGNYMSGNSVGTFTSTTGGTNVIDAGDILTVIMRLDTRTSETGGAPQSTITTTNNTTAAIVFSAQLSTSSVNEAYLPGIPLYHAEQVTATAAGFGSSLSNLSGDAAYNASAFAMLLVSEDSSANGFDLSTATSLADINSAVSAGKDIKIASTYDIVTGEDQFAYDLSSSVNQATFTFGLSANVASAATGDARFILTDDGSSTTSELVLRSGVYPQQAGITSFDPTASQSTTLLTGSTIHASLSGNILPEPSSIAAVGSCLVLLMRRRKRQS